MKKTYISGKISGLKREEYEPLFMEAYNYIMSKGNEQPKLPIYITPFESRYSIINRILIQWLKHMISDVKILVECDKVCFLSNWKQSKGAIIEFIIAKLKGIKIEYYDNRKRI